MAKDLTDEIRRAGRKNRYKIELVYIPEKYDDIEGNSFYWIPKNTLCIKETLTPEEHERELGNWSRRFFGGIAEFYERGQEDG